MVSCKDANQDSTTMTTGMLEEVFSRREMVNACIYPALTHEQ